MIEITFTAETAPELMGKILAFVHSTTMPSVYVGQETVGAGGPPEPKKRGRPPKVAPVPEEEHPDANPLGWEADDRAAAAEEGIEYEEPDVEVDDTPLTPTGEALANEKLKTQVIDSLQALFTAGKVKVVRHVLDKYGNGAKSFPEIDANVFPAIKEALDKGEAA